MAEIKQIKVGGVPYDLVSRNNYNLLYNWDFTNPVNQRGLTMYECGSSWSYTIDRWRGQNLQVGVINDGINIVADDQVSGYKRFQQILGDRKLKAGITVTASIAISSLTASSEVVFCLVNGTNRYGIKRLGNINTPTIITTTYTLSNDVDLPGVELMAESGSGKGFNAVITAVKLEVGSASSFAADITADYTDELIKCERYYRRYGVNTNLMGIYMTASYVRGVMLVGTMHKTPTGVFAIQYYVNSEWKDAESTSVLINGDSVLLSSTIPDVSTPGTSIMMRLVGDCYLDAEIY